MLAQVVDITERSRLEQERSKLQAQVLQNQKMDSLGRLAGGVAHDMNNVLAAILGLASAHVAQEPAGSPGRTAFETIGKAAARGAEMVKGLLRFARQTPREDRLLDLNALVADVVRILKHTTLARIRLQVDLTEGLRPVRGDAGALTGALINLCVNAVDAMAGQGTLALETRNLGTDQVQVGIADTGCGMSPEVLERAMDPFFTTKPQGQGTGLGLPTAYSTVHAHGGTLDIQSEVGKGTRVLLRFPAAPGTAQPAPGPTAESGTAPGPASGAAHLRVLVVDDDDLVRISMEVLLHTLGHACELAASGEEALARLETGPAPDVVVLDVNMPGLGGAGTLPRLRALYPGLPVLLATGRADAAVFDLIAAVPDTTLLHKPFALDDLRIRLEHCAASSRKGLP
jgi:CheY-like chemotaxis protein